MHPLYECLPFVKGKLIASIQATENDMAVDLFSDTGDLETYASTSLGRVLAVIENPDDLKNMKQRCPTRPSVCVCSLRLNQSGLVYLRAYLTSHRVRAVWIYTNRYEFDFVGFENLIRVIRPLISDGASLFLFCVDKDLAMQYAKSRLIYVDRNNDVVMHYHKQSLNNVLSINKIKECCERSGFCHDATMRGDEILRFMNVNALPYDIWSSQIFFLLHYKSNPYFSHLL